ncbi:hypothetical protein R9C00_20345 [Flammeovirgaceae bacterium SG7u.111]|nr:hypothetical protein [Flammeovirgaceae bacterium SG7u.132]WPO34053.1 hypothetical protein R9C00_20345 [Flammeovirgaceae bacterium SG7u.111]
MDDESKLILQCIAAKAIKRYFEIEGGNKEENDFCALGKEGRARPKRLVRGAA